MVNIINMGSPLGPTLANIFLCFYEKKWLSECPSICKPIYYKRYVDDIFLLFKSSEQVQSFRDFMNTRHPNITFTFEKEESNSFSFLDVKVDREKGKFVTSIIRKPTFSDVYTNFTRFTLINYKFGLIFEISCRGK